MCCTFGPLASISVYKQLNNHINQSDGGGPISRTLARESTSIAAPLPA